MVLLILRGQRSQQEAIMSPCTPDACWDAPGTATRRPPPRRWRRRWSSWCQPGCTGCRCSEGGSYCRTQVDRGQTGESDTSRHHRVTCEGLRLTRCVCPPRWTGRPRSALPTWRWKRFPASPERQETAEWLSLGLRSNAPIWWVLYHTT